MVVDDGSKGQAPCDRIPVVIAAFILLLLSSLPQEQRFLDWTKLPFSKEVFDARRARMLKVLESSGGGLFLVPSRVGHSEGFTFRQRDDFLYFTGLELPDSMLVLDADEGKVVLFTPLKDARFDNPSRKNDFPGRLLGADPALSEASGIRDIRSFDALETAVSGWVQKERVLRVNAGRRGDEVPSVASGFVTDWSETEGLIFHLRNTFPGLRLKNAFEDVAKLRMVQGPEEIASMRRVCALTVEAIRHAAGFVRDGVEERELEAELEAAFKRGGSERLAFASIIKSGPNSLWPWRLLAASYERRNRAMRDGDLVIFDVGTELDYYVSDVGRTFPVSGRFTAVQKRTLEMVTAISDTMIAAVRPGTTFARIRDLGIAATPEDQRQYMQVGSFYGHHIGLSSGDPALSDVPLEPGMVFTIEPWYYNHDDELAVFTEDVILVTEDGALNLTADLPRRTEELEKMTGRQETHE